MTQATTGPLHWMVDVARRGGLPGADRLTLPRGLAISDAWTGVSQGTGTPVGELAKLVARHFRLEVAELGSAEPKAIRLLPESVARRFHVFPLKEDYRYLHVATADPVNMDAEQGIGFASGRTPVFQVAPPQALEEVILEHYSPDQAVENILAQVEAAAGGLVELLEEEESKAQEVDHRELGKGPVVKLTNMILQDAILKGASDVHVQPTATGGVVRVRVDGVLRTAAQLPLAVLTRVVARIKIIGRMDIADRLRPQDGRARVAVEGRTFDLRISTVPTRSAEKVVIRILDPSRAVALEEVGVPAMEMARLRKLLNQREGIVVVTGPTGSGKTTTLYGALRELATEDVNIMTVEDPVEYELPGLTQIQVQTKQGVTFASALRAILRQDPDVIFVGEIRDADTAGMAVQASLTGHLVLATLHTNDAVGAIRRLSDLGLDAASITQTLRGALAQRLIRRVCPHCSIPVTGGLSEEEERLSREYGVRPTVRAVGCDQCGHTGFRGRIPLAQLFTMSPEVERLVAEGGTHGEITALATSQGMRGLREGGAERVREGITTLQELERVLGDAEGLPPVAEEPVLAGDAPSPSGSPGNGAAPQPAAGDPSAGDQPVRSLVVDDDTATRIIGKALLESLDHQVVEAADGQEALDRLQDPRGVDLVILDLGLPRVDGLEVLRRIRGTVTTAGLAVIVLTGSTDPSTEAQVMEAGADDYIRKPLDPARFLGRVKAVLRRSGG